MGVLKSGLVGNAHPGLLRAQEKNVDILKKISKDKY